MKQSVVGTGGPELPVNGGEISVHYNQSKSESFSCGPLVLASICISWGSLSRLQSWPLFWIIGQHNHYSAPPPPLRFAPPPLILPTPRSTPARASCSAPCFCPTLRLDNTDVGSLGRPPILPPILPPVSVLKRHRQTPQAE